MQKFLKYGLVPCVIVLGILIGVIIIYNREDDKVFKEENDITKDSVKMFLDGVEVDEIKLDKNGSFNITVKF